MGVTKLWTLLRDAGAIETLNPGDAPDGADRAAAFARARQRLEATPEASIAMDLSEWSISAATALAHVVAKPEGCAAKARLELGPLGLGFRVRLRRVPALLLGAGEVLAGTHTQSRA